MSSTWASGRAGVVLAWFQLLVLGGVPAQAQMVPLENQLVGLAGSGFLSSELSTTVIGTPLTVHGFLGGDPEEQWRASFAVQTHYGLPTLLRLPQDVVVFGTSEISWFGGSMPGLAADHNLSAATRMSIRGSRFESWVAFRSSRHARETESTSSYQLSACASIDLAVFRFSATLRNAAYDELVRIGRDTVFTIAGYDFLSRRSRLVTTPRAYTEGEFTLGWRFGPGNVTVAMGRRTQRDEGRSWALARFSMNLSETLSANAIAGHHAGIPEIGVPAGTVGGLGLHWILGSARPEKISIDRSTAPTLLTIKCEQPGHVRLLLQNVDAIRVELFGDLTDWTEVEFRPGADGEWWIELPASPGLYGVNIRIDGGAWLPAPGLPEADDGYGGTVGLLEVR